MKRTRRGKRGRIICVSVSLFLIAFGTAIILGGKFEYRNYWGGLVFAPFVILIGLLFLYLAIFRWDKLNETLGDKKGRIPDSFKSDWRKW